VDIIVDATGLKMLSLNGTAFLVDDVKINFFQYVRFRVAMLSGRQNMTVFVG
tara:strand:- start:1354 stop:1509 length:156 start_codon:yes stop_codon:yes gene_type:complete